MRICLVGLEKLPIPPRKGGAIEKSIFEVSRRLAKNHSVSVLALGGTGFSSYENVLGVEYFREDSIPLANSTLGKYLFYKNLLKPLKKIDPDIIQLQIRPTLTYLTRLYSHAPNVINVQSYLDGFRMSRYPLFMLEDKLIKLGFKNCATVMPCSNFVGLWLNRYMGVEKQKIRVVYNGVDADKFRYDQGLAERIREKYNLHQKKVLVYVGRIIPEKGVHILLKAFLYVKKRISNAFLFVIGPPGEFGTTTYNNYASKMMKKSDRDVCFTGEISEIDIVPFLCACDVFVYPSIWEEPFGIAIIEAMACQRPVVASGVGGIPEIIDDARSGLLTKPDDHLQLANRVIHLLEDPDYAQHLGREARRRVEREFTWNKIAEKYLRVYEEVVHGSNPK